MLRRKDGHSEGPRVRGRRDLGSGIHAAPGVSAADERIEASATVNVLIMKNPGWVVRPSRPHMH